MNPTLSRLIPATVISLTILIPLCIGAYFVSQWSETRAHMDSIRSHLQSIAHSVQASPPPQTPPTHTKLQSAWETAHASPFPTSKPLESLHKHLTSPNIPPHPTPHTTPPYCRDFGLPPKTTNPTFTSLDDATCLHALTLLTPIQWLHEAGTPKTLYGPARFDDPWSRFTRTEHWPIEPLRHLTLLSMLRSLALLDKKEHSQHAAQTRSLLRAISSVSDRAAPHYVTQRVELEDLVLTHIATTVLQNSQNGSAPKPWIHALYNAIYELPPANASNISNAWDVLTLEETYETFPSLARDAQLIPKGLLPTTASHPDLTLSERHKHSARTQERLLAWQRARSSLSNDLRDNTSNYTQRTDTLTSFGLHRQTRKSHLHAFSLDALLTYIQARRTLTLWFLLDTLHNTHNPSTSLQNIPSPPQLASLRPRPVDPFWSKPIQATPKSLCVTIPPTASDGLSALLPTHTPCVQRSAAFSKPETNPQNP